MTNKVRENRLRRRAQRQGYRLMKSSVRDPQALEYGLYALVDPDDYPDAQRYRYTADEVEQVLATGRKTLKRMVKDTIAEQFAPRRFTIDEVVTYIYGKLGWGPEIFGPAKMIDFKGEQALYQPPSTREVIFWEVLNALEAACDQAGHRIYFHSVRPQDRPEVDADYEIASKRQRGRQWFHRDLATLEEAARFADYLGTQARDAREEGLRIELRAKRRRSKEKQS